MALDNAAINSRLLIILVIIVGLISAVGITISAVALGRPSAPDISISTNNHPISADWLAAGSGVQLTANSISKRDLGLKYSRQHEKRPANKVWMLAFGNDNGAHDYRSEDGTIQGFGVDLVEAVCAVMDLQCRIVFDRYQNCWSSTPGQYPSGGQGLFGQWYDGCVGWSPTRDRLNVFNFSPSYTKPVASKLLVKTGNNKRVADLFNGAIGFVRGFVSDERCLGKGKQNLLTDNIVYVDSPGELVKLIRDDKVGAIFSSDDVLAPYLAKGDLQGVGGNYQCAEDGYAVMTRKDNIFLGLWNEGMEKLKNSGALKNLCNEAKNHHGLRGAIKCDNE